MTTKTIIISLIIVVAICVVVFEYFHKKHAKYTEDELKQFTIDLFAQKGVESIAYDQYIAAVKRHYNISQKAATALVGKAQKHRIVALSNHQVTLVGYGRQKSVAGRGVGSS